MELVWTHLVAPLAVLVGTLKLIVLAYSALCAIWRQCLRRKPDLLKRYGGAGTWALVTGASDGIGLEYCRQLARDGFNICLVSRTQSKLQAAVDSELSSFGVKTKIVVADFTHNARTSFYDDIMRQVEDLDIGLVVLNAGVSNSGYISEIDIAELEQTLDVNVYQYSLLTHKIAKKLESRQAEQSGLVLISSVAAELPGAVGFVTYGASKVFVKYLCMSMDYEQSADSGQRRSKIDVQCLQPGYVRTKLINQAEKKGLTFAVIPVEQCVGASLRDLGSEVCTYGPLIHEAVGCGLGTVWKYLASYINRRPSSKRPR